MLYKGGGRTARYRSARWWRSVKGALRAAEQHAILCSTINDNVMEHALIVWNDLGQPVMNEAA
jgi:hypothetical protein